MNLPYFTLFFPVFPKYISDLKNQDIQCNKLQLSQLNSSIAFLFLKNLSISSFIYLAIYLKNVNPISQVSRRKIPLGVLFRVPFLLPKCWAWCGPRAVTVEEQQH